MKKILNEVALFDGNTTEGDMINAISCIFGELEKCAPSQIQAKLLKAMSDTLDAYDLLTNG